MQVCVRVCVCVDEVGGGVHGWVLEQQGEWLTQRVSDSTLLPQGHGGGAAEASIILLD